MNFDFGEVLSRAWQITWKQRVLWIIGILLGFFVSLMFPLMFAPALVPRLVEDSRTDLALIFLVGVIVAFSLFTLALYPISTLAQTSLALGVLAVEQGGEQPSVPVLLRRSMPFFWRVLGLMLLFGLGTTLIILGLQAILIFFSLMTFGVGSICLGPITLLMYPALYLAIVWMEQAMNSIIVDNMAVLEAARHGWKLVRNNLLPMALMAMIIYFGVGMLTAVLIMPLMLPLFLAPVSFIGHEVNWILLAVSVACIAVLIPLFAVLNGLSMVFTKSAWVLTYLRLTRSPISSSLPPGATS